MTIQTLFFDLDDTLVLEVSSARRAIGETAEDVCKKHGLSPQAFVDILLNQARDLWHASPMHPYARRIAVSSWEALWSPFGGDHPELKRLREWASIYRRRAWYQALREFNIDNERLAGELADRFPVLRRKYHLLFEDTLPCLEWASCRYNLALLSNGASDLQRLKLNGAGLEKWFPFVLISGDIEIRKPRPEYFHWALAQLGLTAREAVMIGNSLDSDVAGANAAGVYSIWLNRDGAPSETTIVPNASIQSLTELPECLACLIHKSSTASCHCTQSQQLASDADLNV